MPRRCSRALALCGPLALSACGLFLTYDEYGDQAPNAAGSGGDASVDSSAGASGSGARAGSGGSGAHGGVGGSGGGGMGGVGGGGAGGASGGGTGGSVAGSGGAGGSAGSGGTDPLPAGEPCDSNDKCLSKNCWTSTYYAGICCDAPCTDPCHACRTEITGSPAGQCHPQPITDTTDYNQRCLGSLCSSFTAGLCMCDDLQGSAAETGIDCGSMCTQCPETGPCNPKRCARGQSCLLDDDCESGSCTVVQNEAGSAAKFCCAKSCMVCREDFLDCFSGA